MHVARPMWLDCCVLSAERYEPEDTSAGAKLAGALGAASSMIGCGLSSQPTTNWTPHANIFLVDGADDTMRRIIEPAAADSLRCVYCSGDSSKSAG